MDKIYCNIISLFTNLNHKLFFVHMFDIPSLEMRWKFVEWRHYLAAVNTCTLFNKSEFPIRLDLKTVFASKLVPVDKNL